MRTPRFQDTESDTGKLREVATDWARLQSVFYGLDRAQRNDLIGLCADYADGRLTAEKRGILRAVARAFLD
jgi:hypothetical protein